MTLIQHLGYLAVTYPETPKEKAAVKSTLHIQHQLKNLNNGTSQLRQSSKWFILCIIQPYFTYTLMYCDMSRFESVSILLIKKTRFNRFIQLAAE